MALRGAIHIIRLSGCLLFWHSRQIIASFNLYASWVSMRNASAIIICSEYISMPLPFGRVIYRSDPYSLTIPLLYMALILLLNVGDVTPNNSTSSCVLIHISLALAFGKCTLPCSSIVIIARFILLILYCVTDTLFHILQFCRQLSHILTNLLIGDFGIYLRGLDVRMSQQSADGLDGYSIGEEYGRGC